MPVEDLWKIYLKDHDVETRNKLIEFYQPFANNVSKKIWKQCRKQYGVLSFDDFCSSSYFGLINAIEKYDPKHKAKFETYCYGKIIGAIKDFIRTTTFTKREDIRLKNNTPELIKELSYFKNPDDEINSKIYHHNFLEEIRDKNIRAITYNFNERNRKIFNLYFFEEKSLEETGKEFNLSGSRISQIISELKIEFKKYYKSNFFVYI